jgi:cyclic-di-GMP-binding protein
MTNDNVPSMNGEQHPAFVTAEECRAWLDQTPLTNPVQALAHLLRQLNLLNRHPLDGGERLAILETLRKPLFLVQEEGARRFVGKPLPLAPPEQAAFDAALAVWLGLLSGYLRCLEMVQGGGSQAPADQLALLVERALGAIAAAQFNSYRAGFQQGADNWRALHDLYTVAEQAGVAGTPVDDHVRQGKTPSSAQAVYAEALLLHAAGPHELPLRHLLWVARWARRWSAKVVVSSSPPADEKTVPLCVDLASSEPAGYRPAEGATARWLDTTGVRQSLKRRLLGLDQGHSPIELQLGDDCWQPACGQVLKHAYQRWCKGGSARRHERQTVNGRCEIVCGVEAIHYHLSDRLPFRQPSFADDDALRRERDELATFGRVARPRIESYGQQPEFQIEEWEIIDESATGVHATRTLGQAGSRIAQGQLIAIRPKDAQYLLLGSVRWSMVAAGESLHAGILMIPGRPEPVAAFAADVTGIREAYRRAFLLPAIPALGSVASIVLPPGFFRSGRSVDVTGGPLPRVRLVQLMDRGVDFDRASYEPAD